MFTLRLHKSFELSQVYRKDLSQDGKIRTFGYSLTWFLSLFPSPFFFFLAWVDFFFFFRRQQRKTSGIIETEKWKPLLRLWFPFLFPPSLPSPPYFPSPSLPFAQAEDCLSYINVLRQELLKSGKTPEEIEQFSYSDSVSHSSLQREAKIFRNLLSKFSGELKPTFLELKQILDRGLGGRGEKGGDKTKILIFFFFFSDVPHFPKS